MRHESSAITVASAMSERTARQVVSVLHGTDSFTFFSMNPDSLLRTKENIIVVSFQFLQSFLFFVRPFFRRGYERLKARAGQ